MQRSLSSNATHSSIPNSLIRKLGAFLVALVLTISMSACDLFGSDDSDDDIPPETARVSFEGDELDLNAFFVNRTDPGEEAFLIYLTEEENFSDNFEVETGDTFGVIGRAGDQPSTGEYFFLSGDSIDDILQSDSFVLLFVQNIGMPSQRVLNSDNGTIELTTSNSSRVVGSFDVNGPGFGQGLSGGPASINGTFDASSVPFFIPQ